MLSCGAAATPATLCRGLRVRVGVHAGVPDARDVVLNATTGRTQYTGQPLSTAKAVADCGHGGMVLLSSATFAAVPASQLQGLGYVLNMGEYKFATDLVTPGAVYQVITEDLRPRLAVLDPELRSVTQLQLGVLQAPLGQVSIAFVNVVGASTLLAWDAEVAGRALQLFHRRATELLMRPRANARQQQQGGRVQTLAANEPAAHGGGELAAQDQPGYVVEMAGGLCLCAFPTSASAILWALHLLDDLLMADWEPELLAHELCEEVRALLCASSAPWAPRPGSSTTASEPSRLVMDVGAGVRGHGRAGRRRRHGGQPRRAARELGAGHAQHQHVGLLHVGAALCRRA